MIFCRLTFYLLILLSAPALHEAVSGIGLLQQLTPNGADDIPTVNYCELTAKPELFNGKAIRVQADYFTTFEWSFLYDLNCKERDRYTNPVLNCDNKQNCKELRSILNKNLSGNLRHSRVKLTIIGQFKGPGEYGKLFPEERGLRFEIRIDKIEKAERIPLDVPWP